MSFLSDPPGNQIFRSVLEAGGSGNQSSNRYSTTTSSMSATTISFPATGSPADIDCSDEEYEYHLLIKDEEKSSNNSMVLLTSRRLLHLKSATFFTTDLWEVDWAEQWTAFEKVALAVDKQRLTLTLRKETEQQTSSSSPQSSPHQTHQQGLLGHFFFLSLFGSGSSSYSGSSVRTLVNADVGHIEVSIHTEKTGFLLLLVINSKTLFRISTRRYSDIWSSD